MESESRRLGSLLDRVMPAETAYAHCDIPCGIYDPHHAQLGAHTVVRMNQLINELTEKTKQNPAPKQLEHFVHDISRFTEVKEKHAEIAKHEVRILWGEFFKEDADIEKWPQLHNLCWKVMVLGSKAKQSVDMGVAEELLETVNAIAEIFWAKKGLETFRAIAPYPTGKQSVYPKLQ